MDILEFGKIALPRRAFAARPADKNAADMWLALCVLAWWDWSVLREPVGRCAVTLTELAEAAQVCVHTARKGLRLLAETGLIHAERVMSGGKILRTRYTLLPGSGALSGTV